ncbi:histidine phosphatase family protein [Bacillus sp. B15-48]|uniref:histidine phosphatase family protein n=1 Tax=Bacillus sp. B15-48 TaxID=1548601 RepID=UPI001EF35198|nr:histidine phosphatase family protein [Bacillus sp. B15-48]
MVITLLRHGMTKDNKRGAYLGWSDSPLCQEEKDKLKNSRLKAELIFTSDLGRCIDTAKLLFPKKAPRLVSEFRELHFGEWEGKTYNELKHNPDYKNWLANFHTTKPPNGESYIEFVSRIERGWENVCQTLSNLDQKRAVIITHGGVIRYMLSKYAPIQRDFWDWQVPHGTGYELLWKNDGWRRKERCTLLQEVPLTAKQIGSGSITT